MAQTREPQKIIIAGAGFGGVRLARRLSRRPEFAVTLVSPEDYFTYYPQLYHAATGGSRSETALDLRELFVGTGVVLVRDRVRSVNADQRQITLESGPALDYDELVLALGSVTNYFNITGLPEFSYDIKSVAGAEKFKRHLHQELVQDKRPDLNYVVVGGGPTGVELAAALGSYLRRICRLHRLERVSYRVDLVEAAPRLLPHSSEQVSRRVRQRLEKLGVQVMTGETVEAETTDALKLKGESIQTRTVIWTAGVANHPFYAANAGQFALAKNGRVTVDQYLQARPHVYVIGDNADTPYCGLAQTAICDANFVADDLLRQVRDRDRTAYRPQAPWSVMPVGPRWAAAERGGFRCYGLPGWGLRRAADLMAYRDIESTSQAIKNWLQDFRREDDCPICSGRDQPPLSLAS